MIKKGKKEETIVSVKFLSIYSNGAYTVPKKTTHKNGHILKVPVT